MWIRLGKLRRIINESLEDGFENIECSACGIDYDPRDQGGELECPKCGHAEDQSSDDLERRKELVASPTQSSEDALEEITGLMPPDVEVEAELADEFAYEGIIADDSVVFSGESIQYLLDSVKSVLVDELGYSLDPRFANRSDDFSVYVRAGLQVSIDSLADVDKPMIYVSYG